MKNDPVTQEEGNDLEHGEERLIPDVVEKNAQQPPQTQDEAPSKPSSGKSNNEESGDESKGLPESVTAEKVTAINEPEEEKPADGTQVKEPELDDDQKQMDHNNNDNKLGKAEESVTDSHEPDQEKGVEEDKKEEQPEVPEGVESSDSPNNDQTVEQKEEPTVDAVEALSAPELPEETKELEDESSKTDQQEVAESPEGDDTTEEQQTMPEGDNDNKLIGGEEQKNEEEDGAVKEELDIGTESDKSTVKEPESGEKQVGVGEEKTGEYTPVEIQSEALKDEPGIEESPDSSTVVKPESSDHKKGSNEDTKANDEESNLQGSNDLIRDDQQEEKTESQPDSDQKQSTPEATEEPERGSTAVNDEVIEEQEDFTGEDPVTIVDNLRKASIAEAESADQPTAMRKSSSKGSGGRPSSRASSGLSRSADEKMGELVDQWITAGDVLRLEHVIIAGQGHRLLNKKSSDEKVQSFLDLTPTYMAKIKSVHDTIGEYQPYSCIILKGVRVRMGSSCMHSGTGSFND